MRETQDPNLYCTVTSSAYNTEQNLCYTAGYDSTVKVWSVEKESHSMNLVATWTHDAHVELVAVSAYHAKVSTASNVMGHGVRVYEPVEGGGWRYTPYGGMRTREQSTWQGKASWGYMPATMQWGKAPGVKQMLLVGYSPRVLPDADPDSLGIPDEKEITGELCVWDTATGQPVSINGGWTQNIFEVAWHPTHCAFVAATSPSGEFEDTVRTQLRLYYLQNGGFSAIKSFDCAACDVNEITIMPNSLQFSYVTASCTDGKTYVWDSGRGETPICVLEHGPSIDDPIPGRSEFDEPDTGVKFAAWGPSVDRFYTGSSDGVLKCWDVQAPQGENLVANLLQASGGISCGAFSPDKTMLLIGDATGKVNLLEIGDIESEDQEPLSRAERIQQQIRIRKNLLPHTSHAHDAHVASEGEETVDSIGTAGTEAAADFVARGDIILSKDPYIGAVQGPTYANTGLYCSEFHVNQADPLSDYTEEVQQRISDRYEVHAQEVLVSRPVQPAAGPLHFNNQVKALDVEDIPPEALAEIRRDMIEVECSGADLDYEAPCGYLGDGDEAFACDDEKHFLSKFTPHASNLFVLISLLSSKL
jgi:hypothetical protein